MEKNFSIVKPEYEKIYKSIQKLSFSEDGILDLINLIDQAIDIARSQDETESYCLDYLLQTKEKQIKNLTRKKLTFEERKKYFEWAKSDFLIDLTGKCR